MLREIPESEKTKTIPFGLAFLLSVSDLELHSLSVEKIPPLIKHPPREGAVHIVCRYAHSTPLETTRQNKKKVRKKKKFKEEKTCVKNGTVCRIIRKCPPRVLTTGHGCLFYHLAFFLVFSLSPLF